MLPYKEIPLEVLEGDLPPHEVNPNGCWLLPNKVQRTGYVQLCRSVRGKSVSVKAHRLFYRKIAGVLSPDTTLDHLCRNRACVRPRWIGDPEGHTEPVSFQKNVRRGIRATRPACSHGHAFTKENTGREAGRRRCLTCKRRDGLAYYHRRRAAVCSA